MVLGDLINGQDIGQNILPLLPIAAGGGLDQFSVHIHQARRQAIDFGFSGKGQGTIGR